MSPHCQTPSAPRTQGITLTLTLTLQYGLAASCHYHLGVSVLTGKHLASFKRDCGRQRRSLVKYFYDTPGPMSYDLYIRFPDGWKCATVLDAENNVIGSTHGDPELYNELPHATLITMAAHLSDLQAATHTPKDNANSAARQASYRCLGGRIKPPPKPPKPPPCWRIGGLVFYGLGAVFVPRCDSGTKWEDVIGHHYHKRDLFRVMGWDAIARAAQPGESVGNPEMYLKLATLAKEKAEAQLLRQAQLGDIAAGKPVACARGGCTAIVTRRDVERYDTVCLACWKPPKCSKGGCTAIVTRRDVELYDTVCLACWKPPKCKGGCGGKATRRDVERYDTVCLACWNKQAPYCKGGCRGKVTRNDVERRQQCSTCRSPQLTGLTRKPEEEPEEEDEEDLEPHEWLQCDECNKWRIVPKHYAEGASEQWCCEML